MSDACVVDASEPGIIALLPNDLHGLDDLVLVEHRVEAELRELLGEVVRRDVYQTVVGLLLGWRVRRQGQVAHNQVVVLVSHVFIEDYLVHTLREVEVHFREQSRRV